MCSGLESVRGCGACHTSQLSARARALLARSCLVVAFRARGKCAGDERRRKKVTICARCLIARARARLELGPELGLGLELELGLGPLSWRRQGRRRGRRRGRRGRRRGRRRCYVPITCQLYYVPALLRAHDVPVSRNRELARNRVRPITCPLRTRLLQNL